MNKLIKLHKLARAGEVLYLRNGFARMFWLYFHVVLVLILTEFFEIKGEKGMVKSHFITCQIVTEWYISLVHSVSDRCSLGKQADCGAIWRTCSNDKCGSCFDGFVDVDGECYSK